MKKLFDRLCRILSGIDADEAMPSDSSPAPDPVQAVTPLQLEVGKEYLTRGTGCRVRITDKAEPLWHGSPYVFEGREVLGNALGTRHTFTADGRYQITRENTVLDLVQEAVMQETDVALRMQEGRAYEDRAGRMYVCTGVDPTKTMYPASLVGVLDVPGRSSVSGVIPFTLDGHYWSNDNPSEFDIIRTVPMRAEWRSRAGIGVATGTHVIMPANSPPARPLNIQVGQLWRTRDGQQRVRITRVHDEPWMIYGVRGEIQGTTTTESYTIEGRVHQHNTSHPGDLVELIVSPIDSTNREGRHTLLAGMTETRQIVRDTLLQPAVQPAPQPSRIEIDL